MINLNEFADALTLAAQAQARLPALEQALASETRRADAAEKGLAEALAIQTEQLKEIDRLRDELAKCHKQPEPQPPRAAFTVDPAFTADALDSERRMWRDRLLATFGADAVTYPDINGIFAGTGDRPTYALGYQTVVEVYMLVIDAIGDPAVFAEINRLMSLIDEARIVYTNDLQESYVVRLYAVYALMLHTNGHADAAAWRDRTLARLNARNGLWGNDALAQCCVNTMLIAHCLWFITGDADYQSYAETARSKFLTTFMCGDYIWWHTLGGAQAAYGVQRTNYVRYDMSALVLLARLGFEVVPIERLAERADGMYKGVNAVADQMDGEGAWNKGDQGWIISFFPVLGAYNPRVRAVSVAAWERTPGHERMPFVPAAMVLGLGV